MMQQPNILKLTRMHSSRMRTDRSSGHLVWGCLPRHTHPDRRPPGRNPPGRHPLGRHTDPQVDTPQVHAGLHTPLPLNFY